MSETIRINSGRIVHQTVDGEVIAIDLTSGTYFSLTEAAALLWPAIVAGTSRSNLAGLLAAAYEGSPEEIDRAVGSFVDELAAEEVVVFSDEPAAATEAAPAAEKKPLSSPRLSKYTNMSDLLLLDPIHDVDEQGWPNKRPSDVPVPLAPVSLIVVVKNGERFLESALESALSQTHLPSEIVVVDGRSTDRTAAIARSFPDVRLLTQEGEGLGAARNQGIAAAKGELIAFLDHDDLWEPAKLEAQALRLTEEPRVEYTLTRMSFFLEPGVPLPARFESDPMERPREAGTPGALVARRSLFDEIGGFSTDLAIGCDADWFARARDRGVPMAVIPQVLLKKRIHEGNLSTDYRRNREEMFEVVRRSLVRRRSGEGD